MAEGKPDRKLDLTAAYSLFQGFKKSAIEDRGLKSQPLCRKLTCPIPCVADAAHFSFQLLP
jgi:hypothetical protein